MHILTHAFTLNSHFIYLINTNTIKKIFFITTLDLPPASVNQSWIFRNFCEPVVKICCYGGSHGENIYITEIDKCCTSVCLLPQELCVVSSWIHYSTPSLSHVNCKTSHVNTHSAALSSYLSLRTSLLNVWSVNPLLLLSISDCLWDILSLMTIFCEAVWGVFIPQSSPSCHRWE